MSYHPTPEDIARIDATLKNKRLSGELIGVSFKSDPDVIQSVLPKPLEPRGNDRVTARVYRWVTNYCGAFTMAGLYVDVVHEGVPGEYMLSMFIDSSDAALLIGREGLGEPKKMASIDLVRSGNTFVGTVDRLGTRLMTLRVNAGEDVMPPSAEESVLYSIKAQLAFDGEGLENDALLLGQKLKVDSGELRPGYGSVVLGGSAHDPLDEFPVHEVLEASFAVAEYGGTKNAGDVSIRAVIPKDEFLPYHYGRLDDWSAHNALGAMDGKKVQVH